MKTKWIAQNGKVTVKADYSDLKKAENFQNSLYSKYESVKLIRWPIFSEQGTYIWEVKGAKS